MAAEAASSHVAQIAPAVSMDASASASVSAGTSGDVGAFCNELEQLFTETLAPEANSKLTEAIFTVSGDEKTSAIMAALINYTNKLEMHNGVNKVPKGFAAKVCPLDVVLLKTNFALLHCARTLELQRSG